MSFLLEFKQSMRGKGFLLIRPTFSFHGQYNHESFSVMMMMMMMMMYTGRWTKKTSRGCDERRTNIHSQSISYLLNKVS